MQEYCECKHDQCVCTAHHQAFGRDRPLVSLNLEMFNKYKFGSVTCLVRLYWHRRWRSATGYVQ